MIDSLFEFVLLASRDSIILAAAVFLLLKTFGKRISPSWRHALWLLVAVRLVLPPFVASPVSWQRLLPRPEAERPVEVAESPDLPPIINTSSESVVFSQDIGWFTILSWIWISVASVFLLMIWIRAAHFRRKTVRLTESSSEEQTLQAILIEVATSVGLRTPRLRITRAVTSPAVTGVFRPEILMPSRLAKQLDKDETKMIFLHEVAHWRRQDVFTNWVLSMLQAIYWFNPFVWYAFFRARIEAERACDASVLRQVGEKQSCDYGELLVRMLELSNSVPKSNTGVIGVLENDKDLRSRIVAIARYSKENPWAALIGIALAVALVLVVFTKAPNQFFPQRKTEWEKRVATTKVENLARFVFVDTDEIEEPMKREKIRRLALRRWLEEDRDLALFYINKRGSNSLRVMALGEFALLDFDAAAMAVEKSGSEETYREFCRACAAEADPQSFLLWANQKDSEFVPHGVYPTAMTRLARKDLDTAKDVALSMRGSPARMNSIRHVAGVWAETNPLEALAWVKTLPASDRGSADQAVGLILPHLIGSNPQLAGEEFSQLKNPRMEIEKLANSLAVDLAKKREFRKSPRVD